MTARQPTHAAWLLAMLLMRKSKCHITESLHAWCRAASARSMASGNAEEEAEEVIAEFGGLQMAGWEDVTPLQPELGMPPVVAIQYDAGDRATMELFAAVLKSGEISERVYNLTTDVGFYTLPLCWKC